MAKKITLDTLAKMMKKGFDENTRLFGETTKQLIQLSGSVNTNTGLLKLTRQEMALGEDLKETKGTVDSIWKMLDDEARFIQQMRTEYPLLLKRLERIEDKLGLPHRILETK